MRPAVYGWSRISSNPEPVSTGLTSGLSQWLTCDTRFCAQRLEQRLKPVIPSPFRRAAAEGLAGTSRRTAGLMRTESRVNAAVLYQDAYKVQSLLRQSKTEPCCRRLFTRLLMPVLPEMEMVLN